MMGDTTGSFGSLDALYFAVRRSRLRLEITTAVTLAREQRLELLRRCEFKRARDLYDAAFQRADGVTDEEPRIHFRELIQWLDSTGIRKDMRAKRDEIDGVIATLAEIEGLRKAGKYAAAFRRFRPLVLKYPVIQFERKYTMPCSVTSTPNGGHVYVNGKLVGQTPVHVDLDIVKRSDIVVKRAGFANATRRVLATDPSLSGELEFELKKHHAWRRALHGRVEARPVLAKDGKRELLLVATSNANLIAVDVKDGTVAWSAETRLLDRIIAAPVVAGSSAYLITVGGVVHRVRLADGSIDPERLKLPGRVNTAVAWDGKTLYAATENKRLVAVRGMKPLYDMPLAQSPTTALLIANGKLMVGSAEGSLMVHSAATGKPVREIRTRSRSSFLGGVALHGDLIVAGAEDGALYAFDEKTGKKRWRYVTTGPVTAPPACGKHIFLPAHDGYVHAIDAKGKPSTRYELSGPSGFAPALANGFLYAASGAQVSAFDTSRELPWWEYKVKAEDGVPEHVIAGPNVVVVVTSRSQVVAFLTDKR